MDISSCLCYTLNSAYNEKKYAEILPCYRWLFINGNVFIGEWGILGAEVFLRSSQFFVKGNFVIGGVECICMQFCRSQYSMADFLYETKENVKW